MSNLTSFERTPFVTDRAMEFFTEKELQMRIGYAKTEWCYILAKELIDNSLDACENADIQPNISITVSRDSLTIADNGPGLPVDILKRSLDYMVRVSDKSYYVSPTRGQQGNALKCCWAAPFVVNGEYGHVEVCTNGINYHIEVSLDRIAQKPCITFTQEEGFVKTGTFIKIHWTGIASYPTESVLIDFYNLVFKFALFNPHACFTLSLPDEKTINYQATNPKWEKWLTNKPTSPHWYMPDRLRSLIAAYVADERAGGRAKTVREFVSEFSGLSSSAKQRDVTELAGLTGAYLHDLINDNDDDIDFGLVLRLWDSMRSESKLIKPRALGVIGEPHVEELLSSYCSRVWYSKAERTTSDDLPYVLEVAFGVLHPECTRMIVTGLNWSPVFKVPSDRLYKLLSEFRVDSHDPVVVVVHLACPRLEFTEQGKGAVALPAEILADLEKKLKSVTKEWTQLKCNNNKQNRVREQSLKELTKHKKTKISLKNAAYQLMQEAYMKASANNTLPANARQIMYAARPLVLALTEGECWGDSSYFTQHLLPDFLQDNPDLTASWDVVFDSRGKLTEPHTGCRVDLGTLGVRKYIRNWREEISSEVSVEFDYRCHTVGASNRFAYALFIEKEGFTHLLEQANIANRYDIAIMSTKGMSVTAARQLVENYSKQGVTILVFHDFDKSGFSIVNTLQSNTRRYKFDTKPNIIDLGLRLTDVEELQLESEFVEYPGKADPKENLKQSGATEAECNFLVRQKTNNGWAGERVELNAMPSDVFIEWLERKFREVGVSKVVPTEKTLQTAYCRAHKYGILQSKIAAILQDIEDEDVVIPDNLSQLVTDSIKNTDSPWDAAIWDLAHQGVLDEIE